MCSALCNYASITNLWKLLLTCDFWETCSRVNLSDRNRLNPGQLCMHAYFWGSFTLFYIPICHVVQRMQGTYFAFMIHTEAAYENPLKAVWDWEIPLSSTCLHFVKAILLLFQSLQIHTVSWCSFHSGSVTHLWCRLKYQLPVLNLPHCTVLCRSYSFTTSYRPNRQNHTGWWLSYREVWVLCWSWPHEVV